MSKADGITGSTTSYSSEQNLVDQFLRVAPEFFGKANRRAFAGREVSAGRRTADVVILVMPRESSGWTIKPLTVFEAAVVSILRSRPSTRIDILESLLSLNRGSLRNGKLRRLVDWGLVLRGRGGQIKLRRGWNSKMELIAIEAKMTKWRQALKQAISYRRYADRCYVLLPNDTCHVVERYLIEFREAGVGLIFLDDSGSILPILEPKRESNHDWQREFVLSRMLYFLRQA